MQPSCFSSAACGSVARPGQRASLRWMGRSPSALQPHPSNGRPRAREHSPTQQAMPKLWPSSARAALVAWQHARVDRAVVRKAACPDQLSSHSPAGSFGGTARLCAPTTPRQQILKRLQLLACIARTLHEGRRPHARPGQQLCIVRRRPVYNTRMFHGCVVWRRWTRTPWICSSPSTWAASQACSCRR